MSAAKKTHWFRNTLIVLVICGLAGTILAAVQFSRDGGRTYASSSIQFSFDGADQGIAPNGNPFDVSGLTSEEVINAALKASGLTGVYTVAQIRENMNVSGQYPEKIAEQMTRYVSLLDTDSDMQAAVQDYRATQYSVVLYNDFDKNMSSSQLTGLLGNIMTAYREYFTKYYSASLDATDAIANLQDYDYSQQLEAISEAVSQQKRYAEELTVLAPDFMVDLKGFGDIAMRYDNLQGDIDRLSATITLNAVSKDRERLQKRYEMEIRAQQYQLDSLTEELKLIEAQVNSYDKDGIIYVSANGSLSQVGSGASDTYDKLVQKRKTVTDQIAQTKAEIAKYQARLDDMSGVTARSQRQSGETETNDETKAAAVEQLTKTELLELQDKVEKRIQALIAKKNEIVTAFDTMLDAYAAEKINEKTVLITGSKYVAPSMFSIAFIIKVVKTAGPFCVVGLIACMILLILSRWKEQRAVKIA